MKRALAMVALSVVCGGLAFGQFPAFTGKWDATVGLLPSTSLTTALTLTTNIAGFDVSGYFRFTGTDGLDRVSFTASGAAGPLSMKGGTYFNPIAQEWMGGYLNGSVDFAGLALGLDVYHWAEKYEGCFLAGTCWPYLNWLGGDKPCQTYSYGMAYVLSTKIDPLAVKLIFADCCTGIFFYKSIITLKDLGLCCGISVDAELAFTKEGFGYLELSGIEIPLCCGVSLTAGVTFTVDGKEVDTGLKFAGIGDACFTVYGNALEDGNAWTGIDIYGWKIKCQLADCNYVQFVTALDPAWYNANVENVFVGDEFEYVKFGFCGAGCCGGTYNVDISIFFQESGSLFGINRLGAKMSIPVMENLTVNASYATPDTFTVGWVFTF
ncbi:MAG TPA: hypothetical protein ENN53_07560 [Candidatus Acetothermia bacterium]|nr:hypothetical protein [Candidatus Acetothermia bacterium]